MSRAWSVGDEGALFLGVPGKVLAVAGRRAIVECWGVRMQVRLDFMDGAVEAGGYVLSHAGFAMRSIAREDIGATFELFETLLRFGVREAALRADVTSDGALREFQPRGRDC